MPGGKGKGKDYCHDWWPEMGKKRKEPEPTDEGLASRQNSLVTDFGNLREENNLKAKEIEP
eukprot:SAG22_NODE_225_length_14728_cov_58.742361_14_plen_61_part_00